METNATTAPAARDWPIGSSSACAPTSSPAGCRRGTPMAELDLCDQLGVSRTPVREALIKLADIGLVNIYPQRGTFVAPISPEAFRHAQFIREHLECAMVAEAVRNIDATSLRELNEILERQQEVALHGSGVDFYEPDELFHRTHRPDRSPRGGVDGHPRVQGPFRPGASPDPGRGRSPRAAPPRATPRDRRRSGELRRGPSRCRDASPLARDLPPRRGNLRPPCRGGLDRGTRPPRLSDGTAPITVFATSGSRMAEGRRHAALASVAASRAVGPMSTGAKSVQWLAGAALPNR